VKGKITGKIILVAGVGEFIGCYLAGELLKQGNFVRAVEKDNVDKALALLRKHAEYHSRLLPEYFLDNQTHVSWRKYIANYENNSNAKIFVALNGDEVIGIVAERLEVQNSILMKLEVIGMITRAFVEKEYRNQGVLRQLLDNLLKRFKKKEVKFVHVCPLIGNRVGTGA
jgi:predicted GNAT family acetyltransferase